MGNVIVDITVSVDGFVAGPRATLEAPLGEGGMRLHEWMFATRSFQERHGGDGGETGADDDLVAESLAAVGATVMGRRMFSGGEGPWENDPNAGGWWGDEPPFRHDVFVVTHHPREPLVTHGTTFTFVTGGVEPAIEQARAAAGARSVQVAGGADVVQQALAAGLLDELRVHVAPVLLGDGVRLFSGATNGLEPVRQAASPQGTAHLAYRVVL